MFNRKSNDSFSTMLAEELLRAELKKLFGDGIRFFHRKLVSTPLRATMGHNDATQGEQLELARSGWQEGMSERHVMITALVGPFERLYPSHPPEDRRRRLRRVEATCRVSSTRDGVIAWHPHYLKFVLKDDRGEAVTVQWRVYEDGCIGGVIRTQNAENPCQDMCDSQTGANYPSTHRELHGLEV